MTRPMLLVLDYPGRRPEAHLAELRLEDDGFDCRYLLTHPLPNAVSTDAYARDLCARTPDCGEAVAMLSYCATAPLASAIAAQIAEETGRSYPTIYFDPSPCDALHIVDGYALAVGQIERGTVPEGSPPLLDVAAMLSQPADLVHRIADDLKQRARLALIADGFDDAEVMGQLEHVTSMYVQWLTYLVAMHHRGQLRPSGEVLHLVSRHHPQDASWLGIESAQTVRVECERSDLARHPASRDHVLAFLARVGADAAA